MVHVVMSVFFFLRPQERLSRQVRFDSEFDDRKGKMRAVNVSMEGRCGDEKWWVVVKRHII